EEDRAAGPQHAMDLPHEALCVDDVLDDLRREHDVERSVRVTQACRDLAVVEDVDLELVDVDSALLGVRAVDGIELDADELGPVVAPEPLEEHPARAAEVENALAGEVAGRFDQNPVRLRIAVLHVEEVALVELPCGVESKLEQRRVRHLVRAYAGGPRVFMFQPWQLLDDRHA